MVKTELRCVGGCFELHTPCAEADKCWISYADDEEVTWMVVMAKYRPSDGDKSNEVVVPLLVEKSTSGVEITSYVDDQICFKLNRFGRIRFNHVRVPFNALMNRFVRWDVSAQKMVFEGSRRGAPPLPPSSVQQCPFEAARDDCHFDAAVHNSWPVAGLLYKMFDRLLVGRLVLSATAVHGTHQTAMLVREHAVKKGFWSNLAVRGKIEAVICECGE